MTSIENWLNIPGNDPNGNLANALVGAGYKLAQDLGDLELTRPNVICDLNAAKPKPTGGEINSLIAAAAAARDRERQESVARWPYLGQPRFADMLERFERCDQESGSLSRMGSSSPKASINKKHLMQFYGRKEKTPQCFMFGDIKQWKKNSKGDIAPKWFNKKEELVVRVAHLFPRLGYQSMASELKLWEARFGKWSHKQFSRLEGVNDFRNCLLLYAPIEQAYDRKKISFVYNPFDQEVRCIVFDRNDEWLMEHCDMKSLNIPSIKTGGNKPSLRLLALHCYKAAKKNSYIGKHNAFKENIQEMGLLHTMLELSNDASSNENDKEKDKENESKTNEHINNCINLIKKRENENVASMIGMESIEYLSENLENNLGEISLLEENQAKNEEMLQQVENRIEQITRKIRKKNKEIEEKNKKIEARRKLASQLQGNLRDMSSSKTKEQKKLEKQIERKEKKKINKTNKKIREKTEKVNELEKKLKKKKKKTN